MVFPCGRWFQLGNRRGHETLQNWAETRENRSSLLGESPGWLLGDPGLKNPWMGGRGGGRRFPLANRICPASGLLAFFGSILQKESSSEDLGPDRPSQTRPEEQRTGRGWCAGLGSSVLSEGSPGLRSESRDQSHVSPRAPPRTRRDLPA